MTLKSPTPFFCGLIASFLPLSAFPESQLPDPTAPSPPPSAAPIANLPSVELQIYRGSNRARQKAIQTLGQVNHPMADKILLHLLHQLQDGILPPFLWLEVLEVAATKTDPEVSSLLSKIRRKNHADPVRNYLECLEGGSAYRGEDVFLEEAACATCHSFQGNGGRIGPDLTGIGGTLERIYILQSIVDPNAVTAPGFQNVLLQLQDGSDLAGILQAEDSESLRICVPPDGTLHTVPVEKVLSKTPLPSAMPPGLAEVLGRRKLRDLVEFLANPR
jgi:quinoprotein glucose dehydrogenase